jgi:histidinol-phosphate phosphatase family protein
MRHDAVFLDKDGTLVQDVPYNVDLNRIRLAPGVAAGLRVLQNAGYRLIVITNQSGVARGYFSEADLTAVFQRLQQLLAPAGVTLTDFYYCPHHPLGSIARYAVACGCRKPEPGLLFRAARDHDIDLGHSWFVGDILNDIEAGRRAGCRTILVHNGGETEWLLTPGRQPHYTVTEFGPVARVILSAPDVKTEPVHTPYSSKGGVS